LKTQGGPHLRRLVANSCLCVLLIAAVMTAESPATFASPQAANEYEIKAAFLLNFAKFVDWPPKSFSDAQSPFLICVIGHDPFGPVLDSSAIGRTVDDRVVEVDRYPNTRNLSEAQHCHIAFVSASEKQHFRKVIDSFQGKSVLLVSDADGFASEGGVIEFQMADDHVGFVINPDAASRADLQVSSKLLDLAKIVHDDPSKGKS
jgi:hypothetical protein